MDSNSYVLGPRPGHGHTHTVILLHGRDSHCEEFASEFFESEASEPVDQPRTLLDLFPSIKWVFPRAPLRHSQRFDTTISQWYDIWSVEDPDERIEIQKLGLRQSTHAILNVIRDEEKSMPCNKIFLGGISQGFGTALSAFFANGGGLAGLLGFCTWMPLGSSFEDIKQNVPGAAGLERMHILYSGKIHQKLSIALMKQTPVLLTHSSDDDIVPLENGKKLHKLLIRLGLKVDWHEYQDGGHWINEPRGIDDIVSFLRANMQ